MMQKMLLGRGVRAVMVVGIACFVMVAVPESFRGSGSSAVAQESEAPSAGGQAPAANGSEARDPGEPTRELLAQRLDELAEAVAERDADALWRLVDSHTRETFAEMLASLQEQVARLGEAQRERVPPGWADGDSLASVLSLDARGFAALFLRSDAGRAAARRLARIEGVERLLWPDRDRFWVHRLVARAIREAQRQRLGVRGEQADEGRVIHFTVRGSEAESAPTTAVFEQGRWRLRLVPGVER